MTFPEGTVTFLITDIEGSTRPGEEQPEVMQGTLARHDELIRDAITQQGGQIIKSTGDGMQGAFTSVLDAMQAALVAQRAMMNESWNAAIKQLRIRIALHMGTAQFREGDYYGPAVNRAARLLSAGHGGQILLSQSTQGLVRDHLPDDVTLVDLGEYKQQDISRPGSTSCR